MVPFKKPQLLKPIRLSTSADFCRLPATFHKCIANWRWTWSKYTVGISVQNYVNMGSFRSPAPNMTKLVSSMSHGVVTLLLTRKVKKRKRPKEREKKERRHSVPETLFGIECRVVFYPNDESGVEEKGEWMKIIFESFIYLSKIY